MKTVVTILIFLLSTLATKAQNVDTVYAFLNQVLLDQSTKLDTSIRYLIDEPDFSEFNEYVFKNKSVNATDSVEIFEAIERMKNFRFEEKRLSHVKILSNQKIGNTLRNGNGWKKIRKAGIKEGFYEMSAPIFFDGGRKAIFSQGFHCGGLCGHGDVSIYERIDGRWAKKYQLISWIS